MTKRRVINNRALNLLSQSRALYLRFLQDESGQATVEYIVILSATVFGVLQLTKQIVSALDTGVLRIGAVLEQDLKTGRADLNVWQN